METSRFRHQEILVGYITPIKDDIVNNEDDSGTEKEDSEEEEGDDPDLFYFNELSSEGEIIKQSTLRRSEVNFTESDGTTKRLLGRFPLSDPWWEVTCSVTQDRRGKLVMPGYPSYRLRSDIDNSVVSLFMKACGMSSDFVSQFIEWLPRERKVNLTNLPEALHEFEKAARIHKTVPGQMNTLVINSDAGYAVRAAHLFPQVMKHLPTLLPHHFAQLLQKGGRGKDKTPPGAKANEEAERKTQEKKMIKLHKLEEIITRDVWKLGFHHIVYRETGLITGEVNQEAFRTCGLFERIPPLQCSALKLYWKMKKETDRDGSTYKTTPYLAMGSEDTADKALEFLKEKNIVVISGSTTTTKQALPKVWVTCCGSTPGT
ncbi:hypothetical protein AGOR_G00015970 [Albula goreensis]|uniref:DNA helicase B winged helix domain-containing protein n=1 Tax=Albula goreensis TaxID=1534307 RepID=A0A8T3EB33_9TELE|nr:hypothetical protein AGOR_G00015970 [Albula goreensis]